MYRSNKTHHNKFRTVHRIPEANPCRPHSWIHGKPCDQSTVYLECSSEPWNTGKYCENNSGYDLLKFRYTVLHKSKLSKPFDILTRVRLSPLLLLISFHFCCSFLHMKIYSSKNYAWSTGRYSVVSNGT